MTSPENLPPIRSNDNTESFPPNSFHSKVQQLIHFSEFNKNGFFDQDMLDALLKGEKPEYDTNTAEGLKKSTAFDALISLREIAENPTMTEANRLEAYKSLIQFAKQGGRRPDEEHEE